MGSYGDNDALIYEPSLGIVVLLSICYGVISLGAVVGEEYISGQVGLETRGPRATQTVEILHSPSSAREGMQISWTCGYLV